MNAPPQAGTARGLLHRTAGRLPPLAHPGWLVALWAGLYLPRVFLLGFYHDDWWSLVEAAAGSAPFSADRLASFFSWDSGYSSRPLAALACFLISSLAGDRAPLWQLANALQVALAAWALRRLLLVVSARLAAPGPAPTGPAQLGVAGFLLTPWNLGMTAWPVASGSLLSLVAFACGAAELLAPAGRPGRVGRGAAWLLGSFLCYESFYLQWWVLVALAAWWGAGRGELVRASLAAAAAQAAAVLYNRVSAAWLPNEATKQLAAGWPQLWRDSLLGLPGELARVLPGPAEFWQLLALGGAGLLLLATRRLASRRLARDLVVLLAASGALAATAALVYSLAGYRITSGGVLSRTTYSLSLAAALPVLAAAHGALAWPSRRGRRVLGGLAAVLAVAGAAGQLRGVAQWAAVWEVQREVLARAPVEDLRRLSPVQDAILFIGPAERDGLVVFGAEWDLTAALRHRLGTVPGRPAFGDVLRVFPATAGYRWQWQAGVLTQDCPGLWVRRFPVRRLHLWHHDAGTLVAAAPGFRFTPADHPEHRR